MKKIVLAVWLAMVVGASGVLVFSTVYEVDVYATIMTFEFHITDVAVMKNIYGEFLTLRINANITNPSHFSFFRLQSVHTQVYLNGEEGEYLRGVKYNFKVLAPGEVHEFAWSYDIEQADEDLFTDADATDTWDWYFVLDVNFVHELFGPNTLYGRNQPYQGVRVIGG